MLINLMGVQFLTIFFFFFCSLAIPGYSIKLQGAVYEYQNFNKRKEMINKIKRHFFFFCLLATPLVLCCHFRVFAHSHTLQGYLDKFIFLDIFYTIIQAEIHRLIKHNYTKIKNN